MKKATIDKKIWVKRTFLDKQEYSYISIPTSQYNEVIDHIKKHTAEGK
jgi:hypothetical protein